MIIKRKYVKFGELFNDPKTKEILEEAWKVFDSEKNSNDWNFLLEERIIDKDMSWCIPNPAKFFAVIEEGFEKLDKESPYDNGLTYKDATGVEIDAADDNIIHLMLTRTISDRQTFDPATKDYIGSIVIKNNQIVGEEEIENIEFDNDMW